jgi:hypothetical protein
MAVVLASAVAWANRRTRLLALSEPHGYCELPARDTPSLLSPACQTIHL